MDGRLAREWVQASSPRTAQGAALFDARDLHAQLTRLDGRHVSTGTAADHNQIEFLCVVAHQTRPEMKRRHSTGAPQLRAEQRVEKKTVRTIRRKEASAEPKGVRALRTKHLREIA